MDKLRNIIRTEVADKPTLTRGEVAYLRYGVGDVVVEKGLGQKLVRFYKGTPQRYLVAIGTTDDRCAISTMDENFDNEDDRLSMTIRFRCWCPAEDGGKILVDKAAQHSGPFVAFRATVVDYIRDKLGPDLRRVKVDGLQLLQEALTAHVAVEMGLQSSFTIEPRNPLGPTTLRNIEFECHTRDVHDRPETIRIGSLPIVADDRELPVLPIADDVAASLEVVVVDYLTSYISRNVSKAELYGDNVRLTATLVAALNRDALSRLGLRANNLNIVPTGTLVGRRIHVNLPSAPHATSVPDALVALALDIQGRDVATGDVLTFMNHAHDGEELEQAIARVGREALARAASRYPPQAFYEIYREQIGAWPRGAVAPIDRASRSTRAVIEAEVLADLVPLPGPDGLAVTVQLQAAAPQAVTEALDALLTEPLQLEVTVEDTQIEELTFTGTVRVLGVGREDDHWVRVARLVQTGRADTRGLADLVETQLPELLKALPPALKSRWLEPVVPDLKDTVADSIQRFMLDFHGLEVELLTWERGRTVVEARRVAAHQAGMLKLVEVAEGQLQIREAQVERARLSLQEAIDQEDSEAQQRAQRAYDIAAGELQDFIAGDIDGPRPTMRRALTSGPDHRQIAQARTVEIEVKSDRTYEALDNVRVAMTGTISLRARDPSAATPLDSPEVDRVTALLTRFFRRVDPADFYCRFSTVRAQLEDALGELGGSGFALEANVEPVPSAGSQLLDELQALESLRMRFDTPFERGGRMWSHEGRMRIDGVATGGWSKLCGRVRDSDAEEHGGWRELAAKRRDRMLDELRNNLPKRILASDLEDPSDPDGVPPAMEARIREVVREEARIAYGLEVDVYDWRAQPRRAIAVEQEIQDLRRELEGVQERKALSYQKLDRLRTGDPDDDPEIRELESLIQQLQEREVEILERIDELERGEAGER